MIACINLSSMIFQEVLKDLPPRFGRYTVEMEYRWKVYVVKHHPYENSTQNWSYPFLDICFYKYTNNGTVIQDIDASFTDSWYKVNSVFPLMKRPFYHLSLCVPRETPRILGQEYNISKCVSHWWDHKTRKYISDQISVSCTKLHPYFPFVSRGEMKTGTREYLMMGSKVVNIYDVEN